MNKLRVTFKRDARETGLAVVAYPYRNTTVKINGKPCGTIHAPTAFSKDDKYHVTFTVYKTEKDAPENCKWKHITLTKPFESEAEAREHIKANVDRLATLVTLYFMEED